jgi:NAD(P)-dependent dehydrogenase (short-subunit alcohol dehydrogenase family)
VNDVLAGRVVALIGAGSEAERAIAVACAEAGAAIALGTQSVTQPEEFAMNSIANEIWAIGRDNFVRVMDSAEATAIASFADEVWDRLGRCDLLVACHDLRTSAPLEELSADEWEATLRLNLTAPFLAAQAFARLMARQGSGQVVVVAGVDGSADAAYLASRAGLREAVALMDEHWRACGVRLFARAAIPPGSEAVSLTPDA